MKRIVCLAAAWMGAAAPVAAQERRYAEDPTQGVALPGTPLAGDFGATAATVNPAGIPFLDGTHVEAAVTGLSEDRVEGLGRGLGLYVARPLAIPLLPRLGLGIAAELLGPPRVELAPDPGTPLRLTFAGAYAVSSRLSFGLALHHFVDADGGAVAGLTTFDLGAVWRLGAHLGLGLVVRDLFAPLAGTVPLERRWDLEAVVRPLGFDILEVAVGVELRERRTTVAPRLRLGVRILTGLFLRAEAELRTRELLDDPSVADGSTTHQLELRSSLGFELSFGGVGVSGYGTGATSASGTRFAGGTVMARWSTERRPSILPHRAHIERIRLRGEPQGRELVALLLRLHRIARDESVAAVFLQFEGLGGGWATLQELRAGIAGLRAAKKKVFGYVIAGSTREYYVAAACDKVYLDVSGGLRLLGMSSSVLFFKDLFDKVGVVAQFEKIAEYKSAPESFTMDASSPEAGAMREALLDDTWSRLLGDLAKDRGLSIDEMRQRFEDGPYTAVEAARAKLVDAVVETDDLERLLVTELGAQLGLDDEAPDERSDAWARPQVAIIYLEGDIVDGKSVEVPLLGQRLAGGETIAQSIAWARENPRIEAIVLRVDSPGGSALASDLIAREIVATRGRKPIIVSIGDIAASGGYFAAAPADLILASPSSVTGSIGIFTGKFDLSQLLGRLGLTWETSRRGAHADMESYLRPYTDEERARVRDKLRYYYARFVNTVARGRGLTAEQVDAVGRGHVWTGAQAKEHHLVDQFGGVVDAVIEAKRRAGLGIEERAEIVMLPVEPESLVERLLGLAGGADAAHAATLPAPLAALVRLLPASVVIQPNALQARLPFVLSE